MATQQYAASVSGVAVRATRLDASGNLMTGPNDSYTLSKFIHLSFTPEYEAGDEITQKAADGTICVSFKAPDTLKRVTLEVSICEPDPEFSTILGGGLLLTKEYSNVDTSVGWSSPQVGEDPTPYGAALEVWSYAVQNGRRATNNPFFHWIFPYTKTRQSGDRVVENGLLANTFEGFGLGNINFDDGPDGKWEWEASTDRPYSYARSSWAPIGYNGFYTWSMPPVLEGTPVNSIVNPGLGINVPGAAGYNPAAPVDYVLASSLDIGS